MHKDKLEKARQKRLEEFSRYVFACDLKSLKALMDAGIDPTNLMPILGYDGNVLHLHASLRHGVYNEKDRALVGYLRTLGVDINAQNSKGETPLHMTALINTPTEACLLCVKELIAQGADIHIKDENGRTPYELAKHKENWRVVGILSQYEAGSRDGWQILGYEKIARTTTEGKLGYRLTEIFNFKGRTLTTLSHNLKTQGEAVATVSFSSLGDAGVLEEAAQELEKRGGMKANDNRIINKRNLRP